MKKIITLLLILMGGVAVVNAQALGTPPLAAPIASPAGGIFTSPQTVTLSKPASSTADYYIRFTVNPTVALTCTTGVRYTQPLLINRNRDLKVIGCNSAGNRSPVVTWNYIIAPITGNITLLQPAASSTVSIGGSTGLVIRAISTATTTPLSVVLKKVGTDSSCDIAAGVRLLAEREYRRAFNPPCTSLSNNGWYNGLFNIAFLDGHGRNIYTSHRFELKYEQTNATTTPAITSVTPVTGSRGGDLIKITGTNFPRKGYVASMDGNGNKIYFCYSQPNLDLSVNGTEIYCNISTNIPYREVKIFIQGLNDNHEETQTSNTVPFTKQKPIINGSNEYHLYSSPYGWLSLHGQGLWDLYSYTYSSSTNQYVLDPSYIIFEKDGREVTRVKLGENNNSTVYFNKILYAKLPAGLPEGEYQVKVMYKDTQVEGAATVYVHAAQNVVPSGNPNSQRSQQAVQRMMSNPGILDARSKSNY